MAAASSAPLSRQALWLCASLLLAPLARAEAPPAEVPAAEVTAPAPAPAAAPDLTDGLPPSGDPALLTGGEDAPESLGWMLTRTLLMFGAVVGCIYLTLNVGLRKLMGLQGVPMGRPSVVSVVERVALEPRRTVFVLKAADEYLLVGSSDSGLQLLSKLDTGAVERIRTERPPATVVPLTPFLQKLLARRDAARQAAPQPSGTRPPGA
ncbi:FliO/MopB family protein [Melittangium boletus]|uniref:FliO/MopB family protein n=1 Tax=Melittangium boletus TaxID=83453 RepID=UPI003DA627EC